MAYVKINERVKEQKKAVPPKKPTKKASPKKGKSRVKTAAMIKNPGGRPCAIDEAAPKILAFIRMGNTYECASACSRISYSTFSAWIRQGKDDLENDVKNSKFSKFLQDVQEAEMDAERAVIGHWMDCIPGNWQAAKEFVARRNPEKWGSREKVDVTSNGESVGKPVFLPLKNAGE